MSTVCQFKKINILIEHLLCARSYSRHWGHGNEQSQAPGAVGLLVNTYAWGMSSAGGIEKGR